MREICLDANGAKIWISNCDSAIASFVVLLAVVDAEDAHYNASRAGHDAVSKISICTDENVTRELAHWHIIRSFLQFEHLLIYELRLLVNDKVRIQWAFVAV